MTIETIETIETTAGVLMDAWGNNPRDWGWDGGRRVAEWRTMRDVRVVLTRHDEGEWRIATPDEDLPEVPPVENEDVFLVLAELGLPRWRFERPELGELDPDELVGEHRAAVAEGEQWLAEEIRDLLKQRERPELAAALAPRR